MKMDLCDLSGELKAVSMIVVALSIQLDKKSDHLTKGSIQDALYGVTRYLDRIADDLDNIERAGGATV